MTRLAAFAAYLAAAWALVAAPWAWRSELVLLGALIPIAAAIAACWFAGQALRWVYDRVWPPRDVDRPELRAWEYGRSDEDWKLDTAEEMRRRTGHRA